MTKNTVVTNDRRYVRDSDTHAIINTDMSEYNLIVQQRLSSQTGVNINTLQHQVEKLANEFTEIKAMILQLIGNNNG